MSGNRSLEALGYGCVGSLKQLEAEIAFRRKTGISPVGEAIYIPGATIIRNAREERVIASEESRAVTLRVGRDGTVREVGPYGDDL